MTGVSDKYYMRLVHKTLDDTECCIIMGCKLKLLDNQISIEHEYLFFVMLGSSEEVTEFG